MKYFYTLMASATLLATSATAAPATLKVDHNTRSQLVAKTGVVNNLKQAKGNRLRVTSLAEAQAMAINNTTKRAKSPAHRAPEADDWTSAGTGVWVVNNEEARTTSIASANESCPSETYSRKRSKPINAACPSLQ